ncbi:MAG: type II secretion system protein [Planctomycetes bacterium]|nr:type II secretion system protein [Planctomycetota bacterium]
MAIKKHFNGRSGFSLMELLVVIAIIMMLIGILVPGMKGVKRIAKNLEQKSLFHNIDIGLEVYRKDFGDYPESRRRVNGGLYYTGAQHFAEAMVGRDGRGFEIPQARKWQWPGDDPDGLGLYDELNPKSIARRKLLYVNLKDTGAFLPEEMYGPGNIGSVVSQVSGQRAPFLADMFYRKRISVGSTGETVKVGSPILYYKADRSSKLYLKDATGKGPADFDTWKYNYNDNEHVINLGTMDDPLVPNAMDPINFYKSITDLNSPFDRPMNENTYILISAGYDGIYGTKDDVTNIKIK